MSFDISIPLKPLVVGHLGGPLPESLRMFRGGVATEIWLTQTKSILPKHLRQAWEGASRGSKLEPIWDSTLSKEVLELCQAQDRRLYGLVLGALTEALSAKEANDRDRGEAQDTFHKIHANRDAINESGV